SIVFGNQWVVEPGMPFLGSLHPQVISPLLALRRQLLLVIRVTRIHGPHLSMKRNASIRVSHHMRKTMAKRVALFNSQLRAQTTPCASVCERRLDDFNAT